MAGKVYVGDIGPNATSEEIQEKFEKYGRLREVWVARNPPGFAFVMFEDPRDADDAVRDLDGTHMCGMRARVEHARARSPRGGPSRFSGRPPRDMVISSRMRGQPRDYGDSRRDRSRRDSTSPPRRRRSYSRSPPRRRRYSPSPPRSSSRRY